MDLSFLDATGLPDLAIEEVEIIIGNYLLNK
jgi:NADPH-dependent 7-cyano-7-deazaguanine reductase QueF-like protein